MIMWREIQVVSSICPYPIENENREYKFCDNDCTSEMHVVNAAITHGPIKFIS